MKRAASCSTWLAGLLFGLCVAGHARSETRLILQTSPVAGFQHYAGNALFPFMQVGEVLTLVRDPDNAHDARAIRVYWHGVQIGHVPRRENPDLTRFMDRGQRVEGRILNLQASRNPWQRVLMEIVLVDEKP